MYNSSASVPWYEMMDFVPYAVPFFLLALAIEFIYGWLKGRNTYRLNDSINSLSLGVISTSIKLVVLDMGGRALVALGLLAPWTLSPHSLWTFIFAFVLYDFCYYWFHRISHERQIFWASHVVHHQSEDYNLSTALRQTGSGFLSWVFYIPCFLLGVPVEVFVSVASLNLIYQFWVHTMHVSKLGAVEWVMVTPSNHRVHHAQNPRYIDRNHGGVFIIWDRLFGTFQEELEEEPVVFGITRPLHSWNPLWANVHVYWQMLRDCMAASDLKSKLYVWVARNGWRPEGAEAVYPLPRCPLEEFRKYDPHSGRGLAWYALVQYLVLLVPMFWVTWHSEEMSSSLRWGYFLLLLWTLVDVGWVLEGRAVRGLETLRLGVIALVPLLLPLPELTNLLLWIYAGLSLVVLLSASPRAGSIVAVPKSVS